MNSKSTNKLFDFRSVINEDGGINIPKGKFLQLKEEGINEVIISVDVDFIDAVQKSAMDVELLTKIEEVQSLPRDVVFHFMKSKGSFAGSKFFDRINF
ncbi:MAG: hypothetical protein HYS25_12380 [Ignavibacteriales bacterium]|nr:hypothetical protein [Ignavibacteriales bacterium]